MIIEIEDKLGEFLGAIAIIESNDNGDYEIWNTKGLVSIADYEFDDIFNTNDWKVRIQLDDAIKDKKMRYNDEHYK